jgi:hypothetical protein
MRAIPLARAARRKHGLEPIVGRDGTLDAADAGAARRIAARLSAAREPAGEPGVSAGEVAALAALDAVLHRLIERERDAGRADLGAAVAAVGTNVGAGALDEVDRAWRGQFREDGRGPSAAATAGGADPRSGPDLLAEVLVLAALNEDPAATSVRELVDDRPLRNRTKYEAVVAATERELGGRDAAGAGGSGPTGGDGGGRRCGGAARVAGARAADSSDDAGVPLPARLREPMLRAPGSLAAQLRWVRRNWR